MASSTSERIPRHIRADAAIITQGFTPNDDDYRIDLNHGKLPTHAKDLVRNGYQVKPKSG